jgi:hypothetical protein
VKSQQQVENPCFKNTTITDEKWNLMTEFKAERKDKCIFVVYK